MWQKMLQVGNSGGSETGSSIVTVFSSLDTSPSDSTVKKAQTITKYNESLFNEYFEYDSTNKQYTVKKDCNALIQVIIYQYQDAGSLGRGALYINGSQKFTIATSSTSGGSFNSKAFDADLKSGDYFYWKSPSDSGWPCNIGIVSLLGEVEYYTNRYGTFNEVIIFS